MKAASQSLILKTHVPAAADVARVFTSAASASPLTAEEAAVTRDLARALSDATVNCVTCHAGCCL